MSYRLFDQGYTADEIKLMKRGKGAADHTMEELRRLKESEHVLNILQTIKASEKEFTKMELAAWRRATARK
jgi:hypothetical protein